MIPLKLFIENCKRLVVDGLEFTKAHKYCVIATVILFVLLIIK